MKQLRWSVHKYYRVHILGPQIRHVEDGLIDQGARLELRAIDGRTAQEAAQAAGYAESVKILKTAEAAQQDSRG